MTEDDGAPDGPGLDQALGIVLLVVVLSLLAVVLGF